MTKTSVSGTQYRIPIYGFAWSTSVHADTTALYEMGIEIRMHGSDHGNQSNSVVTDTTAESMTLYNIYTA